MDWKVTAVIDTEPQPKQKKQSFWVNAGLEKHSILSSDGQSEEAEHWLTDREPGSKKKWELKYAQNNNILTYLFLQKQLIHFVFYSF